MGDGHNAVASVLRRWTLSLWPRCRVITLDTMALRGPRFAKVARAAYEQEIREAPWIYQLFFDALLEHPRFAAAAKRVVSAFFGRPLRRSVQRERPDLILSTFPLGNAAMHWLRSVAGVPVTTAAFIPGFDIHPFWTWGSVDVHFVVHPGLIADAIRFGAGGAVFTTAPLVRPGFAEVPASSARETLGFRADAFVVLVTGGSWGVGSIGRAIRALVRGPQSIQVVAICGRNDRLRKDLSLAGIPRARLVTFGYVDDMPELIQASDVVVTNGAGVTVLEALAAGRPVIAFDPLAGHGRLASSLLERERLGIVCPDERALVAWTMRLADGDGLGRELRANAAAMRDGPSLSEALQHLSSLASGDGPSGS